MQFLEFFTIFPFISKRVIYLHPFESAIIFSFWEVKMYNFSSEKKRKKEETTCEIVGAGYI